MWEVGDPESSASKIGQCVRQIRRREAIGEQEMERLKRKDLFRGANRVLVLEVCIVKPSYTIIIKLDGTLLFCGGG